LIPKPANHEEDSRSFQNFFSLSFKIRTRRDPPGTMWPRPTEDPEYPEQTKSRPTRPTSHTTREEKDKIR
ncbi:16451_t:CDS:1, partial [Gigaspora rosea]